MKNLTQLLFTLFCLCLPAMMQAQDKDDSKYLAGACLLYTSPSPRDA